MKAIAKIILILFLNLFLTNITFAFFGDPVKNFANELKKRLYPEECVAVSYIYDGDTFDITAYSNRWRDRIEIALTEKNIPVIVRKELPILLEDVENFSEKDLNTLWKGLESKVVVVGCYYRKFAKNEYEVEVILKAIRVRTKEVIVTKRFKEKVLKSELRCFTRVIGNIYHQRIERLGGTILTLEAYLNKDCFKPGEDAYIIIKTNPGVYLYIFNIAADGSVTRIYPNKLFPERPLPTGYFEFPPKEIRDKISLRIFAYPEMDLAMESFRVVVSKEPLEVKELPVPENQVLLGKKAGKLSKLLNLLNKGEVSVVDLPYLISTNCKDE